jgi:hypothetical protein
LICIAIGDQLLVDWITLAGLTMPHLSTRPKSEPRFPTSYVMVFFFMFDELMGEVVVQ